jgi:hypothetical protein
MLVIKLNIVGTRFLTSAFNLNILRLIESMKRFFIDKLEVGSVVHIENDWIINGISLHDQCNRMKYVEKPETLVAIERINHRHVPVNALLDVTVL